MILYLNKHKKNSFRIAWFLGIIITLCGCKNDGIEDKLPGPVWVIFSTSNSRLVNNTVNGISDDAEGKIWLATDDGVSAYWKNTWTSIRDQVSYFTPGDSQEIWTVTSVIQDKGKSIWFTLPGGGIERYNQWGSTTPWIRYTEDNGLVSNIVNRVAANLNEPGDIWFATDGGISRFTPSKSDPAIGEWLTFTKKEIPELATNMISVVVTNNIDNSIWFGTQSGTVLRAYYDISLRWGVRTPPDNAYPIKAIAFDRSNNFWIGTLYNAWKHDSRYGDWIEYSSSTTHGKIPFGPVNALAVDNTNKIWFGTGGGLAGLRDTTWSTFTRLNSPLPSDTIKSLFVDYKGNLWIGTTGGVAVYNEGGTRL